MKYEVTYMKLKVTTYMHRTISFFYKFVTLWLFTCLAARDSHDTLSLGKSAPFKATRTHTNVVPFPILFFKDMHVQNIESKTEGTKSPIHLGVLMLLLCSDDCMPE